MIPFLFSFLLAIHPPEQIEADLIITNAKIYTVDSTFSIAQSMAIVDGRILEVGTTASITEKYWSLNMVDLEGKSVFPGFIDGHCHFLYYGINQSYTDLTGTKSFYEVTEKIQNHVVSKTGGWVIASGWDQNDWEIKEFPTKEALDKLFPSTPVFLERVDGHAALVNSKALEMCGITPQTIVAGGEVQVVAGKCTGMLIDNAMILVKNKMPTKTKSFLQNATLLAQEHCLAVGLTSVQDAGLDVWEIQNLKLLDDNNKLKIRVYAMVMAGPKNYEYFSTNGVIYGERLHVNAFKYMADGALGSRGAGLIQPYSDNPDNYGLFNYTYDSLVAEAQKIYNIGFQMCTHAIGDSANRMVLDAYASVLKGKNDLRWRIEHCQVVAKSDIKKFAAYSILPSIQATHCTSDMYWADERLGETRIKSAYAYKSLLQQNGMVIGGSDFPVEHINPLYGFYAAVARKDQQLFPKDGFQKDQALTRQEALKSMTIWAAYGAFEELEKGSLEAGKLADFVILDKDIMTIPEAELFGVKVLATYIGGDVVYSVK
jgi:predicted amidohydrolase YtcJ